MIGYDRTAGMRNQKQDVRPIYGKVYMTEAIHFDQLKRVKAISIGNGSTKYVSQIKS